MKKLSFILALLMIISFRNQAQTSITNVGVTSITLCAGSDINVSYNIVGSYPNGTVFTAQLSDASGSFANPVEIGSATTSTIIASIPQNTSGGIAYYIRVVSGGIISTPTTDLTINPYTIIGTQPLPPVTTCSGTGTKTMSVVATGTGELTYQWYKNNIALSSTLTGYNKANISFTNPTEANAGTYKVRVTGGCGPQVFSEEVVLAVNTNMAITVQPITPAGTCQGLGVQTMSVTAVGIGNLSYQWRRNGINISDNSIVNGAATPSLTLTNPEVSNAGSYTVYVSGGSCGTAQTSNAIPVTVNSYPVITSVPTTPVANCSGFGYQELKVVATGANLTYLWKKNGFPLFEVEPYRTSYNQPTLTFYAPTVESGDGVFTVDIISNGCTLTSPPITVYVKPAPTVSVTSNAPSGGLCGTAASVTFTATPTNAGPNPRIVWYNSGNAVQDGTSNTYSNSSWGASENKVYCTVVTSDVATCPTSASATSGVTNLVTSNMNNNSWISKPIPAGNERRNFVTFSIGNRGYIGTGTRNDSRGMNDFWEFDAISNSWMQKASLVDDQTGDAKPRYNAIGFSIGNRGYVGTGINDGAELRDFWEYDPTSNKWTKKANFPSVRQKAAAFSISNKGYVGCGVSGGVRKKDFWIYSRANDIWTTMESTFPGVVLENPVGFSIGQKGYVVGGRGDGGLTVKMYEYNSISNLWVTKDDFPGIARENMTCFVIGKKAYMGLGYSGIRDVTNTNNNIYNGNPTDFYSFDPSKANGTAPSAQWTTLANFGSDGRAAPGFSVGNKGYVGLGFREKKIWNSTSTTTTCYNCGSSTSVSRSWNWGKARWDYTYTTTYYNTYSTSTSNYVYFIPEEKSDFMEYTPKTDVVRSISTGVVPAPLCNGSTISLPYTVGCNNFNTENYFVAQLSDEFGSFSKPVRIGQVKRGTSGTIPVTIPLETVLGSNYRIRIVDSLPGASEMETTIGYMNEQDITIRQLPDAGEISGSHTVPYPAHMAADVLLNVGSAISTPNVTFLSYIWQKNDEDNTGWVTIPGTTTDYLNFSTSDTIYKYRRGANFGCSATSFTAPTTIKVFERANISANSPSKDGKMSGRVVSVGTTTGVQGVKVFIQKQVSLKGSPASYIDSTTTDGTGNYTIENLFYGDENNGDPSQVKFTITVFKQNHDIRINEIWHNQNPSLGNLEDSLSVGRKTVVLPDFEDLSTIPITGKITQKCGDCLNMNGVAGPLTDNLNEIAVKFYKGSTNLMIDTSGSGSHAPGEYALTASDPAIYKIVPSSLGHKFSPLFKEALFVDATANVNFVDDTTHTVRGVFRAGGNELVGSVQLEFTDTVKGRSGYVFRKQVITGDSGKYSITLPPRQYKVKVLAYIPPFTANTDYVLHQQFTTSTNKLYKVSQAGTSGTMAPTHASGQAVASGGGTALFTYMGAAPNSNTGAIQNSFTQDPIIQDSIKRFFNTVYKDSMIVDIDKVDDTLDLIYHRPPTMKIIGLDDSCTNHYVVFYQNTMRKIVVSLYEGNPNRNVKIATDQDDTLQMITNVHRADQQMSNVDTTYYNPVNGSDTISLYGGLPNLADDHFKFLRFSYTDKYGRTLDSVKQRVFVDGYKPNTGTFTTVSPEVPILILHAPPGDQSVSTWEQNKTTETAMSFSRTTDKNMGISAQVKLGINFEAGFGVTTQTSIWASVGGGLSTNEKVVRSREAIISNTTSVSYSTEPGGGDVFVGAAMNMNYAVANIVELKGCAINTRQDIVMAPSGYATTYTYSEGQIKDVVMPTLQEIADDASDPVQKRKYENQVKVWQQVLDNNSRNKANASFVRNRSFDGNAGPITESTTSSSTTSNTLDFEMEIDKQLAINAGFEIGGSGAQVTMNMGFKMTSGSSSTNTNTTETTIGYTLDDNDAGDYFSVDIKKDKVYNTPVFAMVAGTSSCPPEAIAQSRDMGGLDVPILVNGMPNQVQRDIATNGEALYKLQLKNFSESRETRTYNLKFDHTSNPNGAIITIGGVQAVGSIPFTIPYLGSQTVTVSVRKNPYSSVYSYEGLKFILTDGCSGDDKSDLSENTISAFFASSCSDIRLAQPTNNWVATSASSNVLPIKFNGYNRNNLSSVSLEYAHTGRGDWETGTVINQNGSTGTVMGQNLITNPNETNVNWDLENVADGNYEVRLKLICASGSVYTDRVAGIIDRKAPTLFSNAQPSDHSFVRGDEISFTYNELLNTSAIGTSNIKLIKKSTGQEIPVLISAYQNKINIVPAIDILTNNLGDTLQVIATNISDIYANINTPHADTLGFAVDFMTAGTGILVNLSNVVPTKSSILENSGDSLRVKFKFAAPANTTSNIPVRFIIGGSATYNTDYLVSFGAGQNLTTSFTGSEGTINIPARQDSVILNIKPINDGIWEEGETIKITLVTGGDYGIGSTYYIIDTIKNDDYHAPVITASGALCQGGTITLTTPSVIEGNAITAYQWKRGTAVVGTTQTISVTASGTYSLKVTTANGFSGTSDPYLITNTVSPVSTTLHSICAGELPYMWNGISCSASDTYTANLSNTAGCDSVAQLVLTVIQPSSSIETIFSTGAYIWHGVTYTASNNTATWLEVNALGCDSLVTLNLTIANTCTPTQATFNVEACNAYLWHGIRFNSSVAGVSWVGVNAVGCDSTEYLNLTIRRSATSIRTVYVCGNQFPYVWNGHNYQVAGTYTTLLSTTYGCDSLAKLVLIQKNTSTSTTNLAVCIRKMPFTWNGTSYATAGTYTKLFTNAVGCDSLATLVLTIAPMITSTSEIAVCSNQLPLVWNGVSYTEAGSYSANLISSGGCDSLANLVFTIKQAPAIPSISVIGLSRVCSGQSVTLELLNSSGLLANETNHWSNSQTTPYISVGIAGNYAVTVSNSLGCSATSDSVAVIIDSLPRPTITGAASFCAGGTTALNAGAEYDSYLWSSGETTPNIAVSTQESFSVTVTNSFGCNGSSSVTTSMFNNPINIPLVVASGSTTFCNGGNVNLSVDEQNQTNSSATGLSYLWSNGASTSSVTASTSGDYTVTVSNVDGCFAISEPTTVSVNTVPVPVLLPNGPTTFCSTNSVTFTLGNVFGTNTTPSIPLDEVSGAILAVGLRRLNSIYTGPALRLRRSTDSEEQDFGFVGANLDTAAIATWLAGASGYCTTLYDQAEKDGNVTQPDMAAQPLYVYNGVNNKPSLHFTTTQYMNNEVNYPAPYSLIYGAKVSGTAQRVLSAKNNNWLLGYWGSNMDVAFFEGMVSPSDVPLANNEYNIYAAKSNGTSSAVFKNGVDLYNNENGVAGPNGIELNGYAGSYEFSDCDFTDLMIYGAELENSDMNTLNNSISKYYQVGDISYLWSSGQTTKSITTNSSGDYAVTVTNVYGCSATSSITPVTVNECNVTGVLSGNADICAGSLTPLSLEVGGTGPWSGKLSDGTYFSGDVSPIMISVNPTANTIYTIDSLRDLHSWATPNVMSGIANVTVKPVPTAPVAVVSQQPNCTVAKGTITITPVAGLTYSIDGTTYSSSTSYNNLNAGTYLVTAKNDVGCASPATSVVVNVQPVPSAPLATLIQPSCYEATGTITITALAGLEYSFNGAVYGSDLSFPNLVAGSYTIQAKNKEYGCLSAITTVVLNVQPATPAAPTGLSITHPTCTVVKGTIRVTAISGLMYSIDGDNYSNSTGIFTQVPAGTYSVTARNAAGCVSAATNATINIQPVSPAAPTVTNIVHPTCTVATGTITATVLSGLVYSIGGVDSANTTGLFYEVAPATYNVTAKNSLGCSSPATVITVNAQPITPAAPAVTINELACGATIGSITVTVPVAGYTYSINGTNYDNTTGVFSNLVIGTYYLTAKTPVGCISPATTSVIRAYTPTITVAQPLCSSAAGLTTGTITVTPTAGYTYTLGFNGNYQVNTTGIFSSLIPGTYTVTTKTTTGCYSAAATVDIIPRPAVPAVPSTTVVQATCATATATITVTNPISGMYYMLRNSSNTLIATNNTGIFSGVATTTATTTYSVWASLTNPIAVGCISTSGISSNIYQQPLTATVTAVPNQVFCNATATTAVTFASPTTGGTIVYNWTNNTPSIGLAASGTGNLPVFTTANTTSAPVTATISVTATMTTTINGVGVPCTGTPKTFTITVNPKATITSVSNQVVCTGSTSTAVAFGSPTTGGTITYAWTNNTTSIGLAASGTGNLPSFSAANTTTAPVTATITVTPTYTNGGISCAGATSTFTITVNPKATATAVANQVFCNGANTTAVNFTSPTTGGTIVYNWTNSAPSIGLAASGTGNIAAFAAVNTTTPVVATITVTPTYTNGGVSCAGTASTFTITVTPNNTLVLSSVAGTNAQTVCINTAITPIKYTSTGATGATVTGLPTGVTGAFASNVFTISGTPTVAVTTTSPSVFNYTITYTGGCGIAATTTATGRITVNPMATVTAITNKVVCNTASVAAVAFTSPTTGGTIVYNWTNTTPSIGLAASGTGSIAAFTALNTGTAPVTATITVTPTYTNGGVGCTGTASTFTITVNPTATVVAVANKVFCNAAATTAVTFASPNTGGTIVYNWTNNTPTIGLAASGTGNLPIFTTANTTTAPLIATITATPIYTNGGVSCTGTSSTFTITVNPKATVTTVSNQVICTGAPSTAVPFGSPTTGGTITYAWTNNTTSIGLAASGTGNLPSFTAVNTGIAPVIATITVTPTYANGGASCTGTASTFTITVNPKALVTAVANKVMCNGGASAAIAFASTATGGTIVYNWTNTATSIGLAASGSGNLPAFTAVNTGMAPVIATITVTPSYTNAGVSCAGTPLSFTITVNPKAAVNAITSQVICVGAASTAVAFSSPTTGGTIVYNWTNNVSTIGLAASGVGNIAAFTTLNTTVTPITATITVTPTYTNGAVSCVGTASTFTITVNPRATVTAVANKVVCKGGTVAAVTFGSPTTGGTIVYNWTNSLPSIGLAASGSGNIAAFTAVNTGTAPVIATITVTPVYTNGGVSCMGTASTFTITVNPTATVAAIANKVACAATSIAAVTFTSPTTGGTIVYNWTNSLNTIGLAASGTGNLTAFTAVNTSTSPVTATIAVTPTYTNLAIGCVGTPTTFTILVNPTNSITLTTPIGTKAQTVCVNSAIADISYATVSATGATVTGLPAGVTGAWANNVFTIRGTPTVAGSFTYSVSLTGGCVNTAVATGTIVVSALPTITSAATTTAAVCSASTATLSYTATTGTPTSYSIVWNASPANSFVPVTNQATTFAAAAGTITIAVPANTEAGTYTGTITVKNALGCVSVAKTFTVAVTAPSITVSNPVALNSSSVSQSIGLPYTATSGTPTSYSIVWSSTPTNAFAAVSNQAFSFAAGGAPGTIAFTVPANIALGDYVGTIKVKSANGCVSVGKTFTVSVVSVAKLYVKGDVAPVNVAPVLPAKDLFEVSAYPNPTTTDFKLNINSSAQGAIKITVFDVMGRVVKTLLVNVKQTLTLGSEFKQGMYMIEVRQGKQVKELKVVKF